MLVILLVISTFKIKYKMPKIDFKCILDNVTKLLTSSTLRGKVPITRH